MLQSYLGVKALAKRTRKLTRVNASLQKQNLWGGQTDSQVAKSRKFHAYHRLMRFYNNKLLAINLHWVAKR